ncbi:hypothetical protein PVAG01_05980 [Phlyctema vagabunda]|uniref:Uncharacterized protein n=1 Tax=Phlyctema vagabunda TaxID=108571 RepID=A0ABR4PES6_9HELO
MCSRAALWKRLRLCCIPLLTSFLSLLLSPELRLIKRINKMVLLKDIQGRVYTFKSRSECLGLGILTPDVPDIVRSHMVLVLNIMPGKLDYMKVITITSTLKDNCDYVPISPAPKKGYTIQLRLRNYRKGHHRDTTRLIPILPNREYRLFRPSFNSLAKALR